MKKEDLKHGDILHCKSNGVLGRIIRKVTKGSYNHSALVLIIDGETFIADSQMNGTNLKTFENWTKKYGYVYDVSRYKNNTPEWGKELRKRALSKIGVTGYDFASLVVWQPLYMLTKKWGGRTKEKAENKLYCSEYCGYCHLMPNWWTLNPELLYVLTLTSNHFENFKNIK